MMKSGTTVLAIKYRDGVVVAGDKRMSNGYSHSDDYEKVKEIGTLAMIACAGTVATIQRLVQDIIFLTERLETLIEKPIYVDGQADLLQKILQNNYDADFVKMLYSGNIAVPILAGYNPKIGSGMVFSFDAVGAIFTRCDHASAGSGSIHADPILKQFWNVNMLRPAAEELAILALHRASDDNYTSPSVLVPPTVFSADADGVRRMSDKEALTIAWNIYYQDLDKKSLNPLPDFVQKKVKGDL